MEEKNKEFIKEQVKEQMDTMKEKVTGKKGRNFMIKNAFRLISGLTTLVLSLGAGLLYMVIGQGGEE